jgi:hypothetical protein
MERERVKLMEWNIRDRERERKKERERERNRPLLTT